MTCILRKSWTWSFKDPRSSIPACWGDYPNWILTHLYTRQENKFSCTDTQLRIKIFRLIRIKWTSPNSTSLPCTTTYKIARLKPLIGLVNDFQPRQWLYKTNEERMVYFLVLRKKVERKNIQTMNRHSGHFITLWEIIEPGESRFSIPDNYPW